MRAASTFSGIGGAELALPEAEWLWCAEIEPFPCALLAERFGHPNLGDITAPDFIDRAAALGRLDLLCGGPPCQAFSIAGLRKGMLDPRGLLSLRFIQVAHELADRAGLRNALVENVPGWLSHPENAFGCFLGGLVGADDALPNPAGGSWPRAGMVAGPRARAAWRVLDAQYAGLAQRRERVLLVADLGNGTDPVSVLFERQGLLGNPPPRREKGEDVAATVVASTGGCSQKDAIYGRVVGIQPVSGTLSGGAHPGSYNGQDAYNDMLVAHTLRAEGFDASEDGGTPLVPVPIPFDTTQITSKANYCKPKPADPCHPLAAGAHPPAIAYSIMPMNSGKDYKARETGIAQPIMAGGPVGGNQGGDYICDQPYRGSHGQTDETDTFALLRALRAEVGEEAFAQWGLGISHSFQSQEVLRSEVHGGGVRRKAEQERRMVDEPLSCSEARATGTMLSLWQAGCVGCPPSGWRPSEQLAVELGAHLSQLPRQGASRRSFLRDLWRASCGLGVLREALSAFQTDGRPDEGSDPRAQEMLGVRESGACERPLQPPLYESEACWAVRRLTVLECERLMGFPDNWTLIEHGSTRKLGEDEAAYLIAKGAHVWRDNKGALRTKAAADGPRYKALGNAWAVACVRPVAKLLAERIAA